ncbi:hypothetical protein EKK58_09680 [Candidatus Dependentiae bacterium]|nr:MAG: hypothetical protein EKK58_09680 [Candidatus Dependentiae bacterium]
MILTINAAQSASTLKDMEARARDLRRALSRMDVNDEAFKEAAQEAQNLDKRIKEVKSSMQAVRTETTSFQKLLGGFTRGAAIVGSFLAAFAGFGAIANAARETERLFAVLKNALGGSELKALAVFEQLQEFAATTPFALNEVVGAFTKLQQRNFNPTIEQLRTMGDIAAASGKTIDQFVEAILDAQTGEFERLKEFGVVAKKEGDNVRVTFRGQSETFRNTAENLNAYLLKLGELPGIAGASAAVSQTLDGALSNMSDSLTRLFASVGSSGGFLKSLVQGFTSLVDAANDFFRIPLSESLREQQTEFNALVGILQDVNSSESTRNAAIAELQKNYPDYIGNINLENASQSELNTLLVNGNKLFEQRIFLQQNEEKLIEFAKERVRVERLLFEAQKEQQRLAQSGRANERPITFGTGGGDGLRQTQTRGEGAESRVKALTEALSKLNEQQRAFVTEQTEFAKALGLDQITPTNSAGGAGKAGVVSDAKKEAEAAAGSLAFLRKQIADLQKEIESTPGQSKALEPLIQQLKLAEDALKALEDRIERLKNPQAEAPPSAEEIARQLGLESSSAVTRDETAADRLKLIEFNDFRLEEERLTNEELLKYRKGLSDEERKLREQALSDEEDLRENIKNLAISAVESLSSAFFQIRQNEVQQSTDAALAALDKEFAEKRRLSEGNQQALSRIDREYQRRKEALEKQAAEKRRQIALKEAIIAGALAVVKALTIPGNIVGAIAAGVAAAAQIAVIASQQFAGGGMTGDGSPFQRPDRTGHKPVGVVHANEWVGPKWMVQHPYYGAQIAALEAVRQRGFADGGFSTTPTVAINPFSNSTSDTSAASIEAYMMLAAEFRAFRQDITSWQSRLRVAYTDIESVGGELGVVRVEAGL